MRTSWSRRHACAHNQASILNYLSSSLREFLPSVLNAEMLIYACGMLQAVSRAVVALHWGGTAVLAVLLAIIAAVLYTTLAAQELQKVHLVNTRQRVCDLYEIVPPGSRKSTLSA